MRVARAERIAEAVLYEGYVLYPYRASAAKNQVRWPFGVVAPRAWAERDGSERWTARTECLVTAAGEPRLDIRVRWLRVQRRRLEATTGSGTFVPVDRLQTARDDLVAWDEGVSWVVDLGGLPVPDLAAAPRVHHISLDPVRQVEMVVDGDGRLQGRVTRTCEPLQAAVTVTAEASAPATKVCVRIENTTAVDEGAGRDAVMQRAMTATHVILTVEHGAFVSMIDPPDEARDAVSGCVNDGLWPVLVGPAPARDVLLASPIILYDYPAVAPQSPGDLCDGTEIDEILTLRIMTLTDAEKQEARATDPRARLIVDRSDALPPETLARLHGIVRPVPPDDGATPPDAGAAPFDLPAGEVPGEGIVLVEGVRIARGSAVVLRPRRRADAMDMFLDGRLATVAGVHSDVEGGTYIAVTVDSDPARELQESIGRYFYFSPDEIVPVGRPDADPHPGREVMP